MSPPSPGPGSEIGEETHDDVDQVLVFVDGVGEAVIEDETRPSA